MRMKLMMKVIKVTIILLKSIEKAKKVSKSEVKKEQEKIGKIHKEKFRIIMILNYSMKMIKAV